jgi:hypothetical protein
MTNEAGEVVKIPGDTRTSCGSDGIASLETNGINNPKYVQKIEVTSLDKTQMFSGNVTINIIEPSFSICHRGYATVTLSAAPVTNTDAIP